MIFLCEENFTLKYCILTSLQYCCALRPVVSTSYMRSYLRICFIFHILGSVAGCVCVHISRGINIFTAADVLSRSVLVIDIVLVTCLQIF
jgi:hypothetical protein